VIVKDTKLPGVKLIELYVFEDHRGTYTNTYHLKEYAEKFGINFVEDDFSCSTKDVIRGVHSDNKAWKLISCYYGKIYLVVVNCDTASKDFGKWQSFVLTPANGLQVLVPPNHGVCHLVISDVAVFNYKQSEYYAPVRQSTYRYDDINFKIWWPIKNPILSRRDEIGNYIS